MSRSGYTGDIEDQWQLIRWRGAVASAIRGKRGQAFLREMLVALDKIENRRLVANELKSPMFSEVCALGAVAVARGLDVSDLDPEDHESVAGVFGIRHALACEIMWVNDEGGIRGRETEEERYERVRRWVEKQIKPATE